MTQASQTQKRLNRKETARYITEHHFRISPATLEAFASKGGGPLYSKVGRMAFYEIADLDKWAESRWSPKFGSSSDEAAFRNEK